MLALGLREVRYVYHKGGILNSILEEDLVSSLFKASCKGHSQYIIDNFIFDGASSQGQAILWLQSQGLQTSVGRQTILVSWDPHL